MLSKPVTALKTLPYQETGDGSCRRSRRSPQPWRPGCRSQAIPGRCRPSAGPRNSGQKTPGAPEDLARRSTVRSTALQLAPTAPLLAAKSAKAAEDPHQRRDDVPDEVDLVVESLRRRQDLRASVRMGGMPVDLGRCRPAGSRSNRTGDADGDGVGFTTRSGHGSAEFRRRETIVPCCATGKCPPRQLYSGGCHHFHSPGPFGCCAPISGCTPRLARTSRQQAQLHTIGPGLLIRRRIRRL